MCQVIHTVSRAGPFRPGSRGGGQPQPHLTVEPLVVMSDSVTASAHGPVVGRAAGALVPAYDPTVDVTDASAAFAPTI